MSTTRMFGNVIRVLTVQLNIQQMSVRFARGVRSRNLLSPRTSHDEHPYENDVNYFEDELEDALVHDDTYSEPAALHKTKVNNKTLLEKEQREGIRRKIIQAKEKKYYNGREAYLLTWAAISQIQYLNRENPDEWTPDTLAHCFPVSKDTILKVLQMRRLPYDEIEIVRHDRKVYKNWLRLKVAMETDEDGGPIDPDYSHLVSQQNLSKMVNAAGIASLPYPSPGQMFLTQKALAKQKTPHVDRLFSSLLDTAEVISINKNHKMDSEVIGIEDSRMTPLLSGFTRDDPTFADTGSVHDSEPHSEQIERDEGTDRHDSRRDRRMKPVKYNQNGEYDVSKVEMMTDDNRFSGEKEGNSVVDNNRSIKEINRAKELKGNNKSAIRSVNDRDRKQNYHHLKEGADIKDNFRELNGSKHFGKHGRRKSEKEQVWNDDKDVNEDDNSNDGLTGQLDDIKLLDETPKKKYNKNR